MTNYTKDELRCRTFGHAWDDQVTSINRLPIPRGLTRISLRCYRCTSWRFDLIDRNGTIKNRKYNYAEGYLKPKGSGKPTRSEFRRQLFARQLRARKAS